MKKMTIKKYIFALLLVIFGLSMLAPKTSHAFVLATYCCGNAVCEQEVECTPADGNLCGDFVNKMICSGTDVCTQTSTYSASCGPAAPPDPCYGAGFYCESCGTCMSDVGSCPAVCPTAAPPSCPAGQYGCGNGIGGVCCANADTCSVSSGYGTCTPPPPPMSSIKAYTTTLDSNGNVISNVPPSNNWGYITISPNVGNSGIVSTSEQYKVFTNLPEGGNYTVTANPVSGYNVQRVGGAWGSSASQTFTNVYVFGGYSVSFRYAPISTVTIQGRFVGDDGTTQVTIPGQGVTVSPAGGSSSSTPWWFSTLTPGTSYTITAAPVSGYTIYYKCNGGNCASTGAGDTSLSTTFVPYTGALTKKMQTNGQYVDIYFQIIRPPTCSSLTKDERAGSGGTPVSGAAVPGQTYTLLANIINDDGDHSTSSWNASCGTFTSTNWDYATWQAPTSGGTCNFTYTLNGVNQPACTGTLITPSLVTILGRHVQANGTTLTPLPNATSTTIVGPTGGGSTITSSTANPWDFTNIPSGTYSITALPKTGYNISYRCNNGNCGVNGMGDLDMSSGAYFGGNTFNKMLPIGGNYLDIYFRYVPAPTPPVPCNVAGLGDVNGDGYVTAADSSLVQQYIVGLITLTPAQITRGDVHLTPGLNIQDMILISRYASGIDTTFPACATTPDTATLTTAPVCPGAQTVSGAVLVDTGNNLCASGWSAYTVSTPVQFNRSNGTLTTNTNAAGAYSFADVSACTEATKTLTLQLAAPYTVSAIQMVSPGPWSVNPSYTSPTFNESTPRVINWCVTNGGAWFQVNSGDVRYPRVSNPIPVNGYASTGDNTNAGLFYSSTYAPNYNGKTLSTPNWNVPQEYDYNADFKNGLGSMSYTFYTAQARTKNIPVTALNSSSEDFFSRPSGVYRRNGDLTLNIPAGAFAGGKHIVALVNGNVAINSPINVPTGTGALFIVAAKGSIVIGSGVGTTTLSETPATATQLDGYYSAEGNINILSLTSCNVSTPDRRLNVSGALIANSLHPFASDTTGGKINNSRSLCAAGNAQYPTLSVYSRPEFLTQLTDFYKFTYKTFKEVNP